MTWVGPRTSRKARSRAVANKKACPTVEDRNRHPRTVFWPPDVHHGRLAPTQTRLNIFLIIYLTFCFMCFGSFACIHICVRASGGLDLKLQTVVSWHLGPEPGSFGSTANALNHCTISAAPRINIFKIQGNIMNNLCQRFSLVQIKTHRLKVTGRSH